MGLVQQMFVIFGLLFVVHVTFVLGGFGVGVNLTDFLKHREKRSLIFENGGAAKFVIGPIIMVPFADPIMWRSMICGYNIHVGDYKLPSNPLYPWDKWENIYARSDSKLPLQPDESREFLYIALEYFLSRNEGDGRECLLRSICENAQIHKHMDIIGEVLNVILTPGKENLDPVYREAYDMGKAGTDCIKYFTKCPKGLNFLDQFIEEEL